MESQGCGFYFVIKIMEIFPNVFINELSKRIRDVQNVTRVIFLFKVFSSYFQSNIYSLNQNYQGRDYQPYLTTTLPGSGWIRTRQIAVQVSVIETFALSNGFNTYLVIPVKFQSTIHEDDEKYFFFLSFINSCIFCPTKLFTIKC